MTSEGTKFQQESVSASGLESKSVSSLAVCNQESVSTENSVETQEMESEEQVKNLPSTESVEQTLEHLLKASNMSEESETVTLLIEADSECSQEEESFASSQIVVVEEVECEQESVLDDQSNETIEVDSVNLMEDSAADEAIIISVEEESASEDQLTEKAEAAIVNQTEETSVEVPVDVALEKDKSASEADGAKIIAVEEEEELVSANQSDESAETAVGNQTEESSTEEPIVVDLKEKSDNLAIKTVTSEESTSSDQKNGQAQKRKILSIEKRTGTTLPNIKVNILSKSKNKIQKTVPNKVDPNLVQKTVSPKNPLILPKPPLSSSFSSSLQSNLGKSLIFKPSPTSSSVKTFQLQPLQSNASSFVLGSPLQKPKATASGSPAVSQPLQPVNIPSSYALVRTNVGLALIPADQIKNAGVKKTFIPSPAGKLNSDKTATPPLLAPINTSTLPIVSALKLPTTDSPAVTLPKITFPSIASQNFKLPSQKVPPVLIKPNPNPPSRVKSNTVRIKLGSSSTEETSSSKVSFPFDVCRHPTCTAYRDKVDEDLRIKLHMRSRKIKSLRMAKQRCVKRAVMLKKSIGTLQRQKELYHSIEWLPEDLSKEMLRVQLKPNCRRWHSQALKEFASKLHSISPEAYGIVREMFCKVLPQPKSIHNWIIGSDPNEGIIAGESAEMVEEAEEGEEAEEEVEESESDEEMVEGDESECKVEIEPADSDFFS